MVDKLRFFDGQKSIELAQYPDDAWQWLTGKPQGSEPSAREYFAAVPWLYRGVTMRADAVASMPFSLYSGDSEVDSSDDWTNYVGFIPSPRRMLRLVEMSLALTGKAYQYRVMRGAQIDRLKYLTPTSIQEKLGTAPDGSLAVEFIRTVQGGQLRLSPDEIVYYWLEDPYREAGPAEHYPAKAALMASGVLANVDEFVAGFFKRGAIKAMLLTVSGTPPPAERDKLEKWWKRTVAGVKNAFGSHVVNADKINPVVIGEGLKELENQALTGEKRNDIATALGIPVTKLFSGSASGLGGGGVVEQDDRRFLLDTVIPECEFIEEVLNDQVFKPIGLRLGFRPEALDALQEDERQRSAAFASYVGAGMPPSVAAEMLGLELPVGVEYASLDEWEMAKFERSAAVYGERMAQQKAGTEAERDEPEPTKSLVGADENSYLGHLDKWQRKALKRGPGKAVEFESPFIPASVSGAILGALEATTTTEAIKDIFSNATLWGGYP